MSKIIQVFIDKLKPYKFYIILVLIIVLFVSIGLYIYKKVFTPIRITKEKGYDDIPNRNKTNNDNIEIILFYADWCPHCTKAKPIWTEIKTKYTNERVNGKKIIFTEVDCSDSDDEETLEMIKKYNVEGFPTIKAVYDGKTIDYEASITDENLTNFITALS